MSAFSFLWQLTVPDVTCMPHCDHYCIVILKCSDTFANIVLPPFTSLTCRETLAAFRFFALGKLITARDSQCLELFKKRTNKWFWNGICYYPIDFGTPYVLGTAAIFKTLPTYKTQLVVYRYSKDWEKIFWLGINMCIAKVLPFLNLTEA